MLRTGGVLGLIATKTISEGDSRTAGLQYIVKHGGHIFRARRRVRWPGAASVVINVLHIVKGEMPLACFLDNQPVDGINSLLFPVAQEYEAVPLWENSGGAYRGVDIYGLGFIFTDEEGDQFAGTITEMKNLMMSNKRNCDVIFPYLGGKEILSGPEQESYRYVINFSGKSIEQAMEYLDLFSIVKNKVKPHRDRLKGYSVAERRREIWWQYGTTTPSLDAAIFGLEFVLVTSRVATHICFSFLSSRMVFNEKLVVFPAKRGYQDFMALQSRVHEIWALTWGTSLDERSVYSPPECFLNFPFPSDVMDDSVGQTLHERRKDIMKSKKIGLTDLYNAYHDPAVEDDEILEMRLLHDKMDRAVLQAYGWSDLAQEVLPASLTTETEDDPCFQDRYFWPAETRDLVLSRLLALNAERHAKEVAAGLVPARGSVRSTESKLGESLELFDDA